MFKDEIYKVVATIPCGRVATYQTIAILAGYPRACRAVGNALHHNPYFGTVPCHRVVNAKGQLARKFAFGGSAGQQLLLEKEGILVNNNQVDLDKYGYKDSKE